MPKYPTLALAALLLTPGAALAHAFNLLLVVPAEGAIADDMVTAVTLAANERDWHPDNHSDGHLGGLDVYISDTRDLSDPGAWSEAAPDIVAQPLPGSLDADENAGWLRISPGDTETVDMAALLAEAADPSLPPFDVRFQAETGRAPGEAAKAAYLAARLIDLIIRPLDNAGDAAALRQELDNLR